MKSTVTLLLTGALLLAACKTAKQAQTQPVATATASKCDQVIKYYAEKIKGANGVEISVTAEITINPGAKTITLYADDPDKGKVTFDTVIETMDCNLDAELTAGASTYHGYVKQEDGQTSKAVLKVESKDGAITISNADPDRPEEFIIIVSRWELVQQ